MLIVKATQDGKEFVATVHCDCGRQHVMRGQDDQTFWHSREAGPFILRCGCGKECAIIWIPDPPRVVVFE